MNLRNPDILRLAKLNDAPEIFYSIQGEGRSIGRPSTFVRTSLCNLHCIWCDTDYTWNWKGTPFPHHFDALPGYEKYDKNALIATCSIEEVAKMVHQYPCRNIILTGGEPLMQQPALAHLMRRLRASDPNYRFETETNGTLLPEVEFDALIDQYNVSPKLENSGNSRRLREKKKVYEFFASSPKAFFKFVVSDPTDLSEVLDLLERYTIDPQKVWLMPEGSSREQLEARRLWLTDICKTYGFYFSDRLHVQIWGSKKGV